MSVRSLLVFQRQVSDAGGVVAEDSSLGGSLSIWELVISGGVGGQVIMVTLFVLSFITVYIFFERYFAIKKASKVDRNFMDNIKDCVRNGKIESAEFLCRQSDAPVVRMIEKGISRIGKPLRDIETSIENTGKIEVSRMDNNVNVLATIAGAAPMIGFLGTVIGMILAFHEMASAGGQIDVEMLSTGIYTAMTTTVAGLIVGIMAYVGYNLLVVKVDKVVHKMEATTVEFLDVLNEERRA